MIGLASPTKFHGRLISLCSWPFFVLCFLWHSTPASLIADSNTEGWAWGVGCPGDGASFPGGPFSATAASGFSGSGMCTRTTTHFTKFSFTSSSGGALSTSSLYGIHTGSWLIIPPTLSSESAPIYTVAPVCPISQKNINWVFVQWDTGTRTMTDTYVIGAASYNPSTGVDVTAQYDVTGASYFLGTDHMPGSCTNGVYSVSGDGNSAELNGNIYFAMDGSGVYKSNPGHATFFFPQFSVNPSPDLGGYCERSGDDFR